MAVRLQTLAVLEIFYLYMAVYPAVQQKAQDELDTIIGRDRLPHVEDHSRLPYIDALIKELYRFNPPVSLVPHSIDIDDEYCGYRIPKGSWIMANLWYVLEISTSFPILSRADKTIIATSVHSCMIQTNSNILKGFGLSDSSRAAAK